ncbi:MAG TPA: hypothetical protein VFG89_05750 [Coriobacteriia bacterium]|nr:hypothetical protein [Coriobacteriia bacterium]
MRTSSLARAAAAVVLATAMSPVAAAFAVPASSLVTETPIATGHTDQYQTESVWSDVYEGKVVYAERTSSYDIWLYDSATGVKKKVASSSVGEYRPRIWGDYVVYNRDQASIHLYRISTGTTKTIASKNARSTLTDIYRDKVVYSKYSTLTKTNDIYVYDIDTGKEKKIINSVANGAYADDRVQAIWGNNVLYVVNYKDLRVFNLSTKKSASLGAAGYDIDSDYADSGQNRPAIYQNTVAYVANPDGGPNQVFTYDLASKVREQISKDATSHANPAVYSARVVYTRGSIYNEELVLHDTRAKRSWDLKIGKSMDASIWGDRLAWTDMRAGVQNGDPLDEGASWGDEDMYTGTINTLRIAHSGSMTVSYNTPTSVKITVTKPDGSSVGTGTAIGLQVSSDGVAWSNEGTVTTSAGEASITVPPLAAKRYIRFTYDGTDELPATVSKVMSLTPRVALGAPVAPKTMRYYKSYSVYGSLRPQHSGGTVRIYKYKKVSGNWKRYGYVNARVYKYGDYSRYRANVKLTSKGSWRLRAYENPDSKHAETWSGYDYVTVK